MGIPSVGSTSALVAADFNGDGIADLAVATPTVVGVLMGRGDGLFLPAVQYPVTGSDSNGALAAGGGGPE